MEYPIYIDEFDDNKFIQETETHIIAKGGDGTLLKAIKMHKDKSKPFFGIGAGTLNFLMNSEHKISPTAKYKKFNLIKVKVYYSYKIDDVNGPTIPTISEYQGFNEVMIGGSMNSYIHFNVYDKDNIIGEISGGGLIVSTAQGSTGINKNNGGTISPLSSNNWIITGDKTTRQINYVLEPSKTTICASSRTTISVWIDGANKIIDNVSKIELSKGDKVTVIFNDYNDFKKKRRI